jgi:hypothetical protein
MFYAYKKSFGFNGREKNVFVNSEKHFMVAFWKDTFLGFPQKI